MISGIHISIETCLVYISLRPNILFNQLFGAEVTQNSSCSIYGQIYTLDCLQGYSPIGHSALPNCCLSDGQDSYRHHEPISVTLRQSIALLNTFEEGAKDPQIKDPTFRWSVNSPFFQESNCQLIFCDTMVKKRIRVTAAPQETVNKARFPPSDCTEVKQTCRPPGSQ